MPPDDDRERDDQDNMWRDRYGPFYSPPDRFAHLPESSRKWLADLTPEKIKSIESSIKFYETSKSVGKFNAWLIGGIVGLIITFGALGDTIRKMLGWVK